MKNIPNLDKNFIHRAWALIKPYWCSDERWIALSLLSILSVIGSIWFNSLNNDLNHALQKFEKQRVLAFKHAICFYCFIYASFIYL
ncbi:hypothetical protein [Candidatus Portiera aleyrodidarum]|uniref:Uncharacterized protein n=1 Tax=Candidatus Portiera aleyrodidarum MED (Bemisia tabaci) TaxID=1163752 RepID=A0AAU8S330_9GAMM|nr:hypothetical protein [Candidatus Portiera aleyrodidarum]AFQ24156.1 hypothetical protein B186_203 [Candidatus Portiera aleyrodidarum BT-B-HRs]AFT80557.1 hypothetical protein C548_191 [Candidatus Portiera aleyrodidarum BT-QVLC]AFT80836.1 hypothetical protein C530_192 [Candidatus Portiera aleyrodidarum BT-B-HRs]AJF24132.1 hypothetical protein O3E_01170 [Candidatus Portiera aleyrodidarum MED (Bemisia tabaci)]ASX27284.1 hypothetical protein BA172_01195 [Candidatus Portiera aleyrodidarum MED (Bem